MGSWGDHRRLRSDEMRPVSLLASSYVYVCVCVLCMHVCVYIHNTYSLMTINFTCTSRRIGFLVLESYLILCCLNERQIDTAIAMSHGYCISDSRVQLTL